jgi:NDP-sugar pyrophosphorylase family protein
MLKIGGKPILERVIRRATNQGFYKFIISIHHLGEIIENHFGDGSSFGVEIEYLREEVPLGTAGSLKLLESIPSSPIVVTNGDLLTDINYSEMIAFHETNKSKATMAVRLHEYQNQFGVVKTQGIDIVEFIEKPVQRSFINAGVYVIEPSVISFIRKDMHLDMPELFELARSVNQRVVAYPMYEAWQDIGNPNDFANAILEMASEDNKNDK